MTAAEVWILIFALAAVAGWADDIHVRMTRTKPERDSHGRFTTHAKAEVSHPEATIRKTGHPADEPLAKERL